MTGAQHGPTTMTASMLLLVVTFVVASATAFALTGVVDEVQQESPVVKFDVDVSDADVVVAHQSGDAVAVTALELVVRGTDGNTRVPFTEFTADGDDDGRLEAGESVRLDRGFPDAIELRIVHGETVVYERRLPTG